MDVANLYRQLLKLGQQAGFTYESYGQVGQFSLPSLTRKAAPGKPAVYLSSGIHGDEPAGVLALQQLFAEDFFDRSITWLICPLINPTGLSQGSRENFQGIDLNRDYRELKSEEVRLHRSWLEIQQPYQLALSLHEDWETSGFYLYEINTSPYPCIGPSILETVQSIIPIEKKMLLDEHPVTSPGYILHHPEPDVPEHWPEAIFHIKQHPLLSCTFETPSQLPMNLRIQAQIAAVKTAVAELLKRLS